MHTQENNILHERIVGGVVLILLLAIVAYGAAALGGSHGKPSSPYSGMYRTGTSMNAMVLSTFQ